MPKREDLSSILVIGSGPIIIGQACEFDYSGTQAVKVLKELGYRVVLVNSNPATIMTDPEFADATYIEPITADVVSRILRKERPDAVLPTLGGQTALNVTMELAETNIFDELGIELIGASLDAIEAAEDRGKFKEVMERAGLATPRAFYVKTLDEARHAASELGFPVMVRPSYILGGGGTGLAHDAEEFDRIVSNGIDYSPIGEDWFFRAGGEYFKVSVDDREGSLSDIEASINWHPFEHFGFGAGYNRVNISYNDVSGAEIDFDYTYSGTMIYATYLF